MRKNSILPMVLFVLSLVVCVFPIHGAVIHVTTTDDNVAGSLRAAITTANANNEDDTIHLPAGTYILTGAANEDGNTGGDLDIDNSHSIAIIGEGNETTLIDGSENDRVIHILSGTLSISGVGITRGRTTESNGAGINNAGNLTLTDCRIFNNGINECFFPGDGGGVYNTGTQSLIDSSVFNNFSGDTTYDASKGGDGGGICNKGTQTLDGCTIENNTAGTIVDYSLSDDYRGGSGGGIYNSGTQSLSDCEITGNRCGSGYASAPGGSGGGICSDGGETTLTRCTVSSNITGDSTDIARGGDGGGISNTGTLTLVNCTVNTNRTGHDSYYQRGGFGGGIYSTATLALTNCTVCTNNTAEGGNGGGICVDGGTAAITNTIVANNLIGSTGEGPDCRGTLDSGGYNLIENTGGCTVTGTLTGNITGLDPMLDLPADNGGKTQTCALKQGSPAIDAGNSTGIDSDQRGYPRPVDMAGINNIGDGSDIGAYEMQSHYSISGRVTADGTGLPEVRLTFSHNGGTADTDENGNYYNVVPDGWTGTVTPSKKDYTFTPASRDYTNVTSPQTGRDYTASPFSVSVSITSPQDGAVVSGTVTISVSASSSQARSTIESIAGVEFYIDDNLVETDTTGPYQYAWDTTLYANGNHTVKVKAANAAGQVQESEITVTVENLVHISLSRTRLNFGADTSGIATGSQSFAIGGGAALNWTAAANAGWLECTPTSGTGPGIVTVSMDPSQLTAGTYIAAISVESPNADNSPQTITVKLTVYNTGSTSPPFGSFDTPVDGSAVSGSVPVTGWVLDDIEVEHIKIYREPVAGEGSALVYIGDAITVEGARPDIEIAYPAYPFQYQAGWGYMMLTNFLPDGGNGTFTLHALATDKGGNTVTLGTTTITCDNADAVKPFGAIDTPTQGGTVYGSRYINFGWALTRQPNAIPFDGSTITVLVDGVSLGDPVYNVYREDIAALFPGYANSDGAVGYFSIDTTQYENGVHTISWIVEDDAGNADGIGSRYFTIQNSHGARSMGHGKAGRTEDGGRKADGIPIDYFNPVGVVKGYRDGVQPRFVYPGNNGVVEVDIRETERVVLHLAPAAGYRPVTPLPIGSTFDTERGIFYWQPGPGFAGGYEFVFIAQTGTDEIRKKHIIFNIRPKFGGPGSRK